MRHQNSRRAASPEEGESDESETLSLVQYFQIMS